MRPEDVPEELVQLASRHLVEEYGGHGWPGDVGARELLAAALARWEEIRPYSCSFDCSYCRADEDCPCDLAGCACDGAERLEHTSGSVTGFAPPGAFD